MADSRRRSQSPARDGPSRRRSRSPRRRGNNDREGRGRGGGGFKWKDKRRDTDQDGGEKEKRLERGYRKRSRSPRREREVKSGASVEDKFGVADKFGTKAKGDDSSKPAEKAVEMSPSPAPAPVAHGEPMIIVHINDRLGTKAAIPCLASDPIKLFKAQVAARIGRQPHEILLKRQGERPFKDQLTLEDYGVSNGVQLDLEIDG